ncbi:MAG: LTA synthase family protein [Ruminococcaceae bacterium]|nr:LTA synthase family protein [Oscillospiraceae bacterium]
MLKKLRGCRLMRVLAWVTLPLFPLLCLYLLELMNFGASRTLVLQFVENFPGAVAFAVLVMAIVFVGLLLLFRWAAVACGILGGITLICSYVNFTKVALNGDHFMPQDILMLSNAGNLSSFISGVLPTVFWQGMAVLVLWTVFLAISGINLPLKWMIRLPAFVALVVCAWLPCSNIDKADVLLSRFGMSVFDSALQSSNYNANGFVGAFTVNLLSLNVQEPQNYSGELIEEQLKGYEATPAQKDAEQFDVIVVLSESFFDARILEGVSFSENPLKNYDRLLNNKRCWSGSLYTTAIGGGTVRPEFGVLSGLTCDYIPSVPTPYRYIRQDISTYVSNYRDAGYSTIAMHPYNKKFYSRDSAYGHIGFDQFYGQDEMTQMVFCEYKRGYVTDESTLYAIQKCVDEAKDPVFLFAITMQNHQPYDGIDPSLMQVEVTSDRLSEPALTALTTYTQGLYDADQMLGDLAKWIDRRERPTVLVFFGDHMPTLGSNYLAYNESGLFNSWDGMTGEELLNMYATPFLIYSNRTLDAGLFEENRGNVISDYNLLNAVAVSTGMARTPYMNLLLDFHTVTPIYNVRLGMEITDAIAPFATAMEHITYDRVFGGNYSGESVDTKGKS